MSWTTPKPKPEIPENKYCNVPTECKRLETSIFGQHYCNKFGQCWVDTCLSNGRPTCKTKDCKELP